MYGFLIDRDAAETMTGQLITQMRQAILSGKIASGSKMPPTRRLAAELHIARNTVLQAYEQLIAEGYLTSVRGGGTFAAHIGHVPQAFMRPAVQAVKQKQTRSTKDSICFYAGTPDVSAFPRAAWAKALKNACLDADDAAFGYGRAQGSEMLTTALAAYLYRAKGIDCDPGCMYIMPGTAAALTLITRLLCRGDCCAAVEDPCISFLSSAIQTGGMQVLPVAADEAGLCTGRLPLRRNIRMICVSPTHQYPLGGVLPIQRRLALLGYAQEQDAYIVEDDYDSEFHYQGETIPTLHKLGGERTLYLGSFSNTFYPALRIAYIVLPAHLAAAMDGMMEETDIRIGAIEQLALAGFLQSKQMDRHIYRMKRLYDIKRRLLIAQLKAAFGTRMKISGEKAGLHLVAAFDRPISADDKRLLADHGVAPDYVEDYALVKGKHREKFILGYGSLSAAQIEEGVRRMHKALR